MITENIYITNAYKEVSEFFHGFNLPAARDYIQTSLLAASSKKIWKKNCAANLVSFYDDLKMLFTAAATITAGGCKRQSCIIVTAEGRLVPDFTNFNLYCKPYDETEYWLYIPHYLSVKEFFNPYKALKKAVHYIKNDEYGAVFDEILQYALSHDSFLESPIEWNALQMNIMMQKLAEACYLLHVRTKTESAGVVISTGNNL
jgi:hypothetical protein